MNTTTWILVLLAIGLLVYAFFRGDGLALKGIRLAGATLWQNLALLLAGFLMAGLIQVLIPPELISRWLGEAAGAKGIWIGCLVGGLFPGSPYAAFPVVASLSQAGAGLGAVVGFITAWALWSVSRLPVEMALINPKIALIRYGITFVMPPIAGFIAHSLAKFFR